jgi:hypothetical protein
LFNKKLLRFYVLISYLFISTFVIFKVTKQTYGVNDDVIIQNWLSGSYTGTPELMIRGSATPRISFGFIVSNLYELMPGVNLKGLLNNLQITGFYPTQKELQITVALNGNLQIDVVNFSTN